MRIGVVTTSYPRWVGDPAGSFVAAHVEAMRALGHHVDVIGAHTIDSSLFRGAGAPDELERGRGYLRGAWFTARLTAEIVRRAPAWDLIIAHWLVPALAALPARKPLLAIAHGGDVHTLRRLHLLGPALRLLRDARLVFVSEELRALANVRDALVQPMGIDLAHFAALGRDTTTTTAATSTTVATTTAATTAAATTAAATTAAAITTTTTTATPTIFVAARLVPIKGVDVAIEAHRRLRTPARLVIAGDGPERARLEQLAAEHPAGANVMFLGTVDAALRDRLLREAALVVVPSRVLTNGRSEGMPMIALEALATGVPVVASAAGGLASLQAATRVRPGEPGALAAAIDRVLATPAVRGETLRASVAHLDWTRVTLRLLAHAGCEVDVSSRRRTA